MSPGLVASILVPSAEMQVTRGRPDVVFIGHAASTAFTGLALGWSRYLSKRLRYLPALGVWLWMMWTHGLYNGQDMLRRGHFAFVTAPLTRITPHLFVLAVLATVVYEFVILRRNTTVLERGVSRRRTTNFLAALAQRNLARRLTYGREWLRRHPQDRYRAEPYLARLCARLEQMAS